jgi:hypothetical protein
VERTLFAASLAVLLLLDQVAAQSRSREQRSFCPDGPNGLIIRPVVLPKPVLSALLNSKQAREQRRSLKDDGQAAHLAKAFKGTRISLGNSQDRFFLVIGSEPMSGADNDWFWIVRQSGETASILLWAGGNCLNMEETSNFGLRDISTTWSSASSTETANYSYDGKSYKRKKVSRRRLHP